MPHVLLKLVWLVLELAYGEAKLSFVSISRGNLPANGYTAIVPAVEVALEHSRRDCPTLFQNFTHVHEILNTSACETGAVYDLITNLFGSGQFHPEETSVILYAELDVLALRCTSEDASMADRHRYPTSVSFALGPVMSYGAALIAFLDYFGWKTIAVVNDYRTNLRQWPRSRQQCKGFLAQLEMRNGDISYLEISITDTGGNYLRALREAKSFSRSKYKKRALSIGALNRTVLVVLCCMLSLPQMELLVAAQEMGMNSGEFVFIRPYEGQVPGEPPVVPLGDEKNDTIYDNLWILRSPPVNWTAIDDYLDDVMQMRSQMYGILPTLGEKHNEYLLGSLRAVEVVSTILQNMSLQDGQLVDLPASGRELARRMLGRSYDTRAGPVTVSHKGTPAFSVHLQAFDQDLRSFVTVLAYNSRSSSVVNMNYSASRWKFGRVPRDRPLCGLLNEQCASPQLSARDLPIGVCATVVICLVFTCLVRWRCRYVTQTEYWWLITETDFTQDPSRHLGFGWSRRDPPAATDHLFIWLRGQRAYHTPLQDSLTLKMQFSTSFLQLMSQIRRVDHLNVNKIIGIYVTDRISTCVPVQAPRSGGLYDSYCSRGCVERLILMHRLDDELKHSLVRDLSMAIQYIHDSPLKYHGLLKLSRCLVDQQLTLKVADLAHSRIIDTLTGRLPGSATFYRWSAPELQSGYLPTPYCDMYALTVVAYQIYAEAVLPDQSDLLGFTRSTRWEGNQTFLRTRFPQSSNVSESLVSMFKNCLSDIPSLRPTAKEAASTIAEVAAARGLHGTLFDCIGRRLTAYAIVLEAEVQERKKRLTNEQKRRDAVLAQLLPGQIVQVLRSSQFAQPEIFDEVTLFMGSLAGFSEMTSSLEPEILLDVVAEIFRLYDKVCSEHDVCKLEVLQATCLIASGLPASNGHKHVREICGMSLELRALFADWTPTNGVALRIQAGVHTGPVAAGVIGVRFPRYCVFGSTVNTASRLQSSSQPGGIHVSDRTALAGMQFGFVYDCRGKPTTKGMHPILTYWLTGSKDHGTSPQECLFSEFVR